MRFEFILISILIAVIKTNETKVESETELPKLEAMKVDIKKTGHLENNDNSKSRLMMKSSPNMKSKVKIDVNGNKWIYDETRGEWLHLPLLSGPDSNDINGNNENMIDDFPDDHFPDIFSSLFHQKQGSSQAQKPSNTGFVYGPQYQPNYQQNYPNNGNNFPNPNQHFPNTNQQFPNTNQQFPNTNQQFPVQNNFGPNFEDEIHGTGTGYGGTANQQNIVYGPMPAPTAYEPFIEGEDADNEENVMTWQNINNLSHNFPIPGGPGYPVVAGYTGEPFIYQPGFGHKPKGENHNKKEITSTEADDFFYTEMDLTVNDLQSEKPRQPKRVRKPLRLTVTTSEMTTEESTSKPIVSTLASTLTTSGNEIWESIEHELKTSTEKVPKKEIMKPGNRPKKSKKKQSNTSKTQSTLVSQSVEMSTETTTPSIPLPIPMASHRPNFQGSPGNGVAIYPIFTSPPNPNANPITIENPLFAKPKQPYFPMPIAGPKLPFITSKPSIIVSEVSTNKPNKELISKTTPEDGDSMWRPVTIARRNHNPVPIFTYETVAPVVGELWEPVLGPYLKTTKVPEFNQWIVPNVPHLTVAATRKPDKEWPPIVANTFPKRSTRTQRPKTTTEYIETEAMTEEEEYTEPTEEINEEQNNQETDNENNETNPESDVSENSEQNADENQETNSEESVDQENQENSEPGPEVLPDDSVEENSETNVNENNEQNSEEVENPSENLEENPESPEEQPSDHDSEPNPVEQNESQESNPENESNNGSEDENQNESKNNSENENQNEKNGSESESEEQTNSENVEESESQNTDHLLSEETSGEQNNDNEISEKSSEEVWKPVLVIPMKKRKN